MVEPWAVFCGAAVNVARKRKPSGVKWKPFAVPRPVSSPSCGTRVVAEWDEKTAGKYEVLP